jgi:hypothetical protein
MAVRGFVVLVLFGVAMGCARQPSEARTSPRVQEHIRNIIGSLPRDSSMRRTLIQGQYGTGVRQPWMSKMSEAGVRVAMLEVCGFWHGFFGFSPKGVRRTNYRKEYDGLDSEVTDGNNKAQIDAALGKYLTAEAYRESAKATSFGIDETLKYGTRCVARIYLYDDEWVTDLEVSSHPPILDCSVFNKSQFYLSANLGDAASVADLLSTESFSKNELDAALFAASRWPSDNRKVMQLLIDKGADVNSTATVGQTPLMASAETMNLSNVKFLIEQAADVSRTDRDGSTSYDLVNQAVERMQGNDYRVPEYLPELLATLRVVPARAHG